MDENIGYLQDFLKGTNKEGKAFAQARDLLGRLNSLVIYEESSDFNFENKDYQTTRGKLYSDIKKFTQEYGVKENE